MRRAAAERSLSHAQTAMVEQLVLGDGGVQVVRAPSGAGKTLALDAARAAWQSADLPALGCALSARAACELRDQTVIDATTIAQLRMALNEGARLQPGSVLIVDEAGMVGTPDLAALADATGEAGARLVLVGDDRQLPEIAAGAFAELARQGPTVELHEVHRRTRAWDRNALSALRDGDLEAFVDGYTRHDRIVALPNVTAAREQLVEDWWQATQDDKQTLMLAHRRADVTDLNERARARMRAADQLGPDELECPERSFAVGNRVIATRNDRRLDVHNGQAGVLTAIEPGLLTCSSPTVASWSFRRATPRRGTSTTATRLPPTARKAPPSTRRSSSAPTGSPAIWATPAQPPPRGGSLFPSAPGRRSFNEPAAALTASEDVVLAQGRLRETEQRLADLEEELTGVGGLRRGKRAAFDRRASLARDDIAAAGGALHDLVHDEALPQIVTARDPLAGVEPPSAPAPGREPGLAPTRDTGLNAEEAGRLLGGIPKFTVLQMARDGRLAGARRGQLIRSGWPARSSWPACSSRWPRRSTR